MGKIDDRSGSLTVTISEENNIKYVNILIDLDNENLSLCKTYLYVGSLDGLDNYYYEYEGKDCYNFYNWFFQKEEISNTHTFKIALSDITEK